MPGWCHKLATYSWVRHREPGAGHGCRGMHAYGRVVCAQRHPAYTPAPRSPVSRRRLDARVHGSRQGPGRAAAQCALGAGRLCAPAMFSGLGAARRAGAAGRVSAPAPRAISLQRHVRRSGPPGAGSVPALAPPRLQRACVVACGHGHGASAIAGVAARVLWCRGRGRRDRACFACCTGGA